MPSLLRTVVSIFKMAILMAATGGKEVNAMLIAFDLFESSTESSFLLESDFCGNKCEEI